MMPVVRINDATFADLKSIATWRGTKTPSETIDLIVRESMEQLGMEQDREPQEIATRANDGAIQFAVAPGLAFTKPLAAVIDGKSLHNPRWLTILLAMIAQVKAKGLEGYKLAGELAIPAKAEQYEQEGFKYYPDIGISVQGQSAQDSWKEIERIAGQWHIPVTVEFRWRQKPKAQYPGKTGTLQAGKA